MQYVFNSIQNDMESLCDQRVLERLEGEQRREYGRTLLLMTNESYPRSFGTTSLSNGSRFIKKRIEAIVRFKKYPQGMGVVSVCIAILLIPLVLGKTFSTYKKPTEYMIYFEETESDFNYQLSLASSRLIEYETISSAIDAYAKSLLTGDKQVFLSVSPETIYNQVENRSLYFLQDINSSYQELYFISGLKKETPQTCTAYLLFSDQYNVENEAEYFEFETYVDYTIVPIKISKDYGWVVEQNGGIISKKGVFNDTYQLLLIEDCLKNTVIQKQNKYTVSIEYESRFYMEKDFIENDMMVFDEFDIWDASLISREPSLDIDFERALMFFRIDYKMIEDLNEKEEYVGMTVEPLEEKASLSQLETPFLEEELLMEYSDLGARTLLEKSDMKDNHMKTEFFMDEKTLSPTQYYSIKIWFSEDEFIELRLDVEKGEIYECNIN